MASTIAGSAHAIASSTPPAIFHASRSSSRAPVAASSAPAISESGQIMAIGENTGGNSSTPTATSAAARGASTRRRNACSPNRNRPLCRTSIGNGPAATHSTGSRFRSSPGRSRCSCRCAPRTAASTSEAEVPGVAAGRTPPSPRSGNRVAGARQASARGQLRTVPHRRDNTNAACYEPDACRSWTDSRSPSSCPASTKRRRSRRSSPTSARPAYARRSTSTTTTRPTAPRGRRGGRRRGPHARLRRGKGNVVRRMFQDIEADIYVMVDGDDTYDASVAPELVEQLVDENLDMVVGARVETHQAAYRAGHRLGNRVLTGLVALAVRRADRRHALGLPRVLAAVREELPVVLARVRDRDRAHRARAADADGGRRGRRRTTRSGRPARRASCARSATAGAS